VLVKNENPYKYNVKQMVHFQRSTVGIIYQSFNLIPSLSVLDNVTLPLIFAGIGRAERDRRGMQLLKRFGVDQQAHKLSTNLSGGQSQRVAVARSLVNDPEILFADEPVGNLDSLSADAVMGTLEEINMKDRKTVILVTHDAKLLPYAHRVYYLRDGQVEREVINPQKKQIKQTDPGTSVLSEIEKLARIYPYASAEELRVKSIVNFLTQDIGFDTDGFAKASDQDAFCGTDSCTISVIYDQSGNGNDLTVAKRGCNTGTASEDDYESSATKLSLTVSGHKVTHSL